MKNWESLFLILAILVSVVLYFLKKNRNQNSKVFGLVALLALLIETIGLVSSEMDLLNGALYNSFVLVEYLLFLFLFTRLLKLKKGLSLILALLGIGPWLYQFTLEPINEFIYTDSIVLFAIVLVVLSILALMKRARMNETALTKDPLFWMLLGLAAYFGSIIPLISLYEFLVNSNRAIAQQIYVVIPIVAIIRYICLSVGYSLEKTK